MNKQEIAQGLLPIVQDIINTWSSESAYEIAIGDSPQMTTLAEGLRNIRELLRREGNEAQVSQFYAKAVDTVDTYNTLHATLTEVAAGN